MKAKQGDRFVVIIADGCVLMEATNIRCGDVWDCYPVDTGGDYSDEYGRHMVFTDEDVAEKTNYHKRQSQPKLKPLLKSKRRGTK